jgi:putative colanic acid biosynthesis UDP-glucose lipid carrier transferase
MNTQRKFPGFAERRTVPAGLSLRRPAAYAPSQTLDAAPDAANDRAFDNLAPATLKRLLDLMVAIPLTILAAPLLMLIALAVKLESAGPALFCQQRLGQGGVPFTIFKFRTMSVQENGDVVVQAKRGDARITRLGGFLRRWSLDELPQLLNVLKGDMSLVGPRPHARAHDEFYAREIGHYTLRQRVKPGITGWAQINGHRGETPTIAAMRARVDHDVWYVAHSGIGLDLEILLRTAIVVLRRSNAF